MLYNARNLADRGLLKRPCQVQFVMGIPNALPPRRKLLEFLISELNHLMPDATWSAAGIGRQQLEVNHWCLELGGHVRTGLEDNIKFDKDRLRAAMRNWFHAWPNCAGNMDGTPPARRRRDRYCSCPKARNFGQNTGE